MTIETFIHQHTRIEDNFVAWREVTTRRVYPDGRLSENTTPVQAADLDENAHLRSCRGQVRTWCCHLRLRTGHGVAAAKSGGLKYGGSRRERTPPTTAAQATLFPAHRRARRTCASNTWTPCSRTTRTRRRWRSAAKPGICWREVSEFECRHERKGEQDLINFEITSERCGVSWTNAFTTPQMEPEIWGRRWQLSVASVDLSTFDEFEEACPNSGLPSGTIAPSTTSGSSTVAKTPS